MLNSLATIMLVCMGVAQTSVAPIYTSNQEQEKPILTIPKNTLNDYHLRAEWTKTNTESNTNHTWEVEKWTAYNYNNALEVRATTYFNYQTLYNNGDIYYEVTTKYNGIETDNLLYAENITQLLIVLQVRPYSYQIDTEETTFFNINIDVEGFYNISLEQLTFVSGYYIKTDIYQSTDTNWANYLNQQLTNHTTRNVIDDITNINNGYYYKHETNIKEESSGFKTISEELQYTPNKPNYIVINYIPYVEIEESNISAYMEEKPIEYATRPGINGRPSTPPYIQFDGTAIIPSGTYEIIDVPGMMFDIIGMPFAFISTAFNLTIFPGTPYQINISNLILAVFAVLVLTWLLTKVVK